MSDTMHTNSTMDRPVDPKKIRRKKRIRYAILGLIILVLVSIFVFNDYSSSVRVNAGQISIDTVQKNVFQDYITILGTVEPIQTIFLDATEGGKVEKIYVREGTMVKKGDRIVRLSNDNLLLEISNYETEVARAVNDLKTMRINLENQQINNQSQLVEDYYDLLRLKRAQTNSELLFKEKYISQEEYNQAQENYARKKKLYELLSRKAKHDSASFVTQINSSEVSVESMQENLVMIRRRLNNLTLKAPVNGELATLNPELGQVIAMGTQVGTVNILDSYKVKAGIDEHYIARVKLYLTASCEFSGLEYPAKIIKIYPEVKDGKFYVDLEFTGKTPDAIRIGETSRIRLELGASETVVLIPRGGFFQSTGGQWVYLLDRSGSFATKQNIRIGRQNPKFYEILEGLKPGQRVITSGYDNFGNADKLILKN